MKTHLDALPSVWEEKLYSHLVGHVAQEYELLSEYAKAAEGTESKAMAYIVRLLLEDEMRHHRLFTELADSLRGMIDHNAEPVVPWSDFERADREKLLPLIERLLILEAQDKRELKELQGDLRDMRETTLWALLVDTMQRDTSKHIALLRFARAQTRRSS